MQNERVNAYKAPGVSDCFIKSRVGLNDFTGLCLTNINICPHYNFFPDKYENCDCKIEKFCKECNAEITKIYDGEALIIDTENDNVRKIKGEIILGR